MLPQSTRSCRTCQRELPYDAFDHRYKANGRLAGYLDSCRECRAAPRPSKQCPRCKLFLPREMFDTYEYPGKTDARQIHSRCRKCETETAAERSRSFDDRFWSKVTKTDTCWLRQGKLRSDGYATVTYKGRNQLTHRVAYQLAYGPISNDIKVLHRCDVRNCVRPDHLFLGTLADNIHDMIAKGRDRKVRGEDQHAARLTTGQVLTIRARYAAGHETQEEIARDYGVATVTISDVTRRKSWRHLP